MDASHVYVVPYQYPNLSEGADRVAGQLRGDKECPFSDVTKSGRVRRKVPESDARSVDALLTLPLTVNGTLIKTAHNAVRFNARCPSRRCTLGGVYVPCIYSSAVC